MSNQRILALDGLRGLAIAYVMLGHFGPNWLDSAGPFGVGVFFALSGRLMADVLFIEGMDWREFAVRRLARLYPALIFFMICLSGLSVALGRLDLLADWWCYPIFAVNLVVVVAARFPPFDHLWSVSMEVQAYILLALIAFWLTGRLRALALLAGAIFAFINGLTLTYIAHRNSFLVYWRPDVGVAVIFASAFLRLALKDVHLPSWASPIALAVANCLMLFSKEPWVSFTLEGVLLAFVAASVERSSTPVVRLFQNRGLTFLGTISYSLYIWQQLFMYAYQTGFPLVGSVSLSLLIATCSYSCIERPGKDAIIFIWRRHVAPDTLLPTRH